jgi:hypothetical protein
MLDMETQASNATKLIEQLREVHLLVINEIERLKARIAELEAEGTRMAKANHGTHRRVDSWNPAGSSSLVSRHAAIPSLPTSQRGDYPGGVVSDRQVAEYLGMSLATVRRWRILKQGPTYFKIGTCVR